MSPRSLNQCFVVSAENPELEVSSSGKYERNLKGLLQYSKDHHLEGWQAEGADGVGGIHRERGLAFPSISLEYALHIAREFGQEAIFQVSEGRQDVIFVNGGRITCTDEERLGRQRSLSCGLSAILFDEIGREFDLPSRVVDHLGWRLVGSPDNFRDIGILDSARRIYRTVDDGQQSYKPLAVLVDFEFGQVRSFAVRNRRAAEDGSDSALVSSRVHLDNCVFSDQVKGLSEPRRWYYVYKSEKPYDDQQPTAVNIYVGESGLAPDLRIAKHRSGERSSKWVRNFPGDLDRSLMPEVVLPNEATSKAFEEWYACLLRQRPGFVVRGGH